MKITPPGCRLISCTLLAASLTQDCCQTAVPGYLFLEAFVPLSFLEYKAKINMDGKAAPDFEVIDVLTGGCFSFNKVIIY